MRRILVFIISALLASCYAANGQNLLERLGQRAKNAVENKLGEKVEQGVNDVLDGKIGKKKKKDKDDKQTADPVSQDAVAMPDAKVPAQPKKQVETSYAKTDFVPGDEIFFEDIFENEQLGEFPSRWDLVSGYAEVGSIEGRKIIAFTDDGSGAVMPLMKEPRTFLPDVFTLEYDVFLGVPEITKMSAKAAAIRYPWFLATVQLQTMNVEPSSFGTGETALPLSIGTS